MNREFIPYEQALALKELGFDEPCFGWWFTDEKKQIIDAYSNNGMNEEDTRANAKQYYNETYRQD
jgi:hypothetical protein